MAEAEADGGKRRKGPGALLLALPAALLLGGGAFYAVYAGHVALPFGQTTPAAQGVAADAAQAEAARGPWEAPAFVALEPLVIALGPRAEARHLHLVAHVETAPGDRAAVEAVRPRIADVLNTFLRAVEESDLAEPQAMIRLRAQMLRRVRLVAPPGAVRDLLIEQFVLN